VIFSPASGLFLFKLPDQISKHVFCFAGSHAGQTAEEVKYPGILSFRVKSWDFFSSLISAPMKTALMSGFENGLLFQFQKA